MTVQFVAGIIVILIVVVFFIPTIDTLSVSVSIPPDQNTVNIVPNRITYYQSITLNIQNVSTGTIEVRITLNRVSGEQFSRTYTVAQGNWMINTYQGVSKGDAVIIEIPRYNDFRKVIRVV